MTTARERLLAVPGVVLGLMWLVAAAAKIASPHGAYQLTARAAPPGVPPKLLLTLVVAAEALLGAAMCLRLAKGFGWSLAGLVAVAAAALVVRSQMGGVAPCGCFGALFGSTLDGALARLAALGAVHAALMFAGRGGTSEA